MVETAEIQNLIEELENTKNNLEQAQEQIKTLKAELEFEVWHTQDYRKSTEWQFKIKDNTIRLAQEQLDEKDQEIEELTGELSSEEELVDIKQRRLDNLTDKNQKLEAKLSKLTSENEDLTQLVNKLKKKKNYSSNRQHNLQRINSLNQKVKDLTTERDNLQSQFNNYTYSGCYEPRHSDYEVLKQELEQKEAIIRQQAQRIRELENKPPVVETKTQTIIKIEPVIKEKLIEKTVEKLIDNSNDKQEIIKLQKIVQQLEEKMTNQPVMVKTKLVEVPNKQQEVWVLRSLLLVCILIGLISLVRKKKNSSKKID